MSMANLVVRLPVSMWNLMPIGVVSYVESMQIELAT